VTRSLGVLLVTGAGISAESGLPTFRGAGGYWRTFAATDLATVAAFERHPDTVWDWYRERRGLVRSAQPNAAHDAIVKLALHSRDFLLVTQNVDDLHTRASYQGAHLDDKRIVQIHGDLFVTRCSQCDFSRRDEYHDEPGVPMCPRCGAPLRPGVVWFDEELDPQNVARVTEFILSAKIDAVLVIGTTATFDYIVEWATRGAHMAGLMIEINPDETPLSRTATRSVREPATVAVPKIIDELLDINAGPSERPK
jgi:NAD-dependent deacetylase